MAQLIDTWSAEVAALAAQGWVVMEYSRYDPTHAIGVTPSGKAFTLSVVDGVCTLTIAGNVRVQTEAERANWEPADATRALVLKTHRSFPGNQR